jgi:Lactoylglutathione lyase and related lyases
MDISGIRNLTVFVSDQDRAKSFYVDVLGFQVRGDMTMGDNRWLEVAPADSGTAIVLHKPFPGMVAGSSQGVILDTADLDADCKALEAAGVPVDGPQDMPWGRQATFSDPDGNGYVLSASAPQG